MRDFKLIIFDCDGTLTTTRSGATFRKDPNDWQWMPNRLEKITSLRNEGVSIAITTNQGGPIWRVATGQEKYPSAKAIARALRNMMLESSRLHKYDPWFISLYDKRASEMVTRDQVISLQREMFDVLGDLNVRIGIEAS